eukprot:Sro1561_g282610.2  (219) ;mRNA; f:13437-14093
MQVIRNTGGRDDDEADLILVNTVRLDDDGLAALDGLGAVKHIVRLAAFHGMDDPFYKARYPQATVWAVDDAPYFPNFETKSKEVYFQADKRLEASSELPAILAGVSFVVIESEKPKDGILVLERPEGKVLITGDSLQNMDECDAYFNYLGRLCMKMMGFISPCQVGPAWKKVANVQPKEMRKLLDLQFDHVLPAHGRPVLGQAWKRYEASILGMGEEN